MLEIKALSRRDEELWAKTAMYAENCSWQTTGEYLSKQMKNQEFSDWERVFAAVENGDIAGFCTLSKTSSVFRDLPVPILGFVFVGEPYRGNQISRQLCLSAIEYAKTVGFDQVYLYSDLHNFYEKYGFVKIDEKEAPWGVKQSIYVHATK